MTLDIEKLKQAIDDNQAAGWPAMQIPVCHARELITRLEAAEKQIGSLTEELNNRCTEQYQLRDRMEAAEQDAAKYKWLCKMHTKSHTDWFVYAATGPDLDVEVTAAMKESK